MTEWSATFRNVFLHYLTCLNVVAAMLPHLTVWTIKKSLNTMSRDKGKR